MSSVLPIAGHLELDVTSVCWSSSASVARATSAQVVLRWRSLLQDICEQECTTFYPTVAGAYEGPSSSTPSTIAFGEHSVLLPLRCTRGALLSCLQASTGIDIEVRQRQETVGHAVFDTSRVTAELSSYSLDEAASASACAVTPITAASGEIVGGLHIQLQVRLAAPASRAPSRRPSVNADMAYATSARASLAASLAASRVTSRAASPMPSPPHSPSAPVSHHSSRLPSRATSTRVSPDRMLADLEAAASRSAEDGEFADRLRALLASAPSAQRRSALQPPPITITQREAPTPAFAYARAHIAPVHPVTNATSRPPLAASPFASHFTAPLSSTRTSAHPMPSTANFTSGTPIGVNTSMAAMASATVHGVLITIEHAIHLPLLPAAAVGTPGSTQRLTLPNTYVSFTLRSSSAPMARALPAGHYTPVTNAHGAVERRLNFQTPNKPPSPVAPSAQASPIEDTASRATQQSGTTPIVYQSVCPKWNYTRTLSLDQLMQNRLPSTAVDTTAASVPTFSAHTSPLHSQSPSTFGRDLARQLDLDTGTLASCFDDLTILVQMWHRPPPQQTGPLAVSPYALFPATSGEAVPHAADELLGTAVIPLQSLMRATSSSSTVQSWHQLHGGVAGRQSVQISISIAPNNLLRNAIARHSASLSTRAQMVRTIALETMRRGEEATARQIAADAAVAQAREEQREAEAKQIAAEAVTRAGRSRRSQTRADRRSRGRSDSEHRSASTRRYSSRSPSSSSSDASTASSRASASASRTSSRSESVSVSSTPSSDRSRSPSPMPRHAHSTRKPSARRSKADRAAPRTEPAHHRSRQREARHRHHSLEFDEEEVDRMQRDRSLSPTGRASTSTRASHSTHSSRSTRHYPRRSSLPPTSSHRMSAQTAAPFWVADSLLRPIELSDVEVDDDDSDSDGHATPQRTKDTRVRPASHTAASLRTHAPSPLRETARSFGGSSNDASRATSFLDLRRQLAELHTMQTALKSKYLQPAEETRARKGCPTATGVTTVRPASSPAAVQAASARPSQPSSQSTLDLQAQIRALTDALAEARSLAAHNQHPARAPPTTVRSRDTFADSISRAQLTLRAPDAEPITRSVSASSSEPDQDAMQPLENEDDVDEADVSYESHGSDPDAPACHDDHDVAPGVDDDDDDDAASSMHHSLLTDVDSFILTPVHEECEYGVSPDGEWTEMKMSTGSFSPVAASVVPITGMNDTQAPARVIRFEHHDQQVPFVVHDADPSELHASATLDEDSLEQIRIDRANLAMAEAMRLMQ